MTYLERRRAMRPDRHRYWWIIANYNGKPILIFGGSTEDDARLKGITELGGANFSLKELATRDPGRASQMIRGVKLEDTHNLAVSLQRQGHERTLNQMRKRLHRRER